MLKKYTYILPVILSSLIVISCTTSKTTTAISSTELELVMLQWHNNTLAQSRQDSNELTRKIEPNMSMAQVARIVSEINSESHPNGKPTEQRSEIRHGTKIDIIEYWYYHVSIILIFDNDKLIETDRRLLSTMYGYVE